MKLTPYRRNRNLSTDLFDQMDWLFDDWGRSSQAAKDFFNERVLSPSCDISEANDHFLMSVDIPGMKPEDIKIEVANNILTISGERKREEKENDDSIQHYEKSYGYFKRSFSLPTSIESESVEARYENGVLELFLPKTQTAKSRQIEIQSGTRKNGGFEKISASRKSDQQERSHQPSPEDTQKHPH